jgi:hypothetical protein
MKTIKLTYGTYLTAESAAMAHDEALFKADGIKSLPRLNYPERFKNEGG